MRFHVICAAMRFPLWRRSRYPTPASPGAAPRRRTASLLLPEVRLP